MPTQGFHYCLVYAVGPSTFSSYGLSKLPVTRTSEFQEHHFGDPSIVRDDKSNFPGNAANLIPTNLPSFHDTKAELAQSASRILHANYQALDSEGLEILGSHTNAYQPAVAPGQGEHDGCVISHAIDRELIPFG